MSEKHGDEKEKHSEWHGHGGGGGHSGGSHEEHEGAPEWLISFADNVTLMMGFFVIMLAFSMGPKGGGEGKGPDSGGGVDSPPTFLDVAVSIRDAFHNPVNLNSQDPNDAVLAQHLLSRQGAGMSRQVGPEGSEHDVQSLRPSKYYSVCGVVSFDRGSAAISPDAVRSLDAVAKHVRGLRFIVDVRGNVSAEEAFGDPEHNVRLGFERALSVANALVQRGLDWRQLHVLSCADNDRVQPIAYDESGHQRNRRVDIVVTDMVMADSPSSDSKSDQP